MSGNFGLNSLFLLLCFAALSNGNELCSKHCLVYYDGCNVCGCKDGETTLCTEMKCPKSTEGDFICKECESGYSWNNKTRQCENQNICRNHCQVYFDGCNECICNKNNSMVCSKLVCFFQETPKCSQCDNGYEWNPNTMECEKKCFNDCDIWFDGCNDYECNSNNTIISKTQRVCKRHENAHCKKCESNMQWNDCGSACTATCMHPNPICSMICTPRCECPPSMPIYHRHQCIQRKDCLIHLSNE